MSLANIDEYLDVEKELKSFKFPKAKSFRTRAIHEGQEPEQWSSRATVPPIHTSSTYALEDQHTYVNIYIEKYLEVKYFNFILFRNIST